VKSLSRYDQATHALWSRGHAALRAGPTPDEPMAQAAVHAMLAGLRTCHDGPTLFRRYELHAAADFALVGSLLPGSIETEQRWELRDAAFYLRWQELYAEAE
jgi:hypothetical protein